MAEMLLVRRDPHGLSLVLDDGVALPIRTANGDVRVQAFFSSYDYWGGADDEYWSDCALLRDSTSLVLIVSAIENNSYTGIRTSNERAYRSVDGGHTWTEVDARWPEPRAVLAELSTRETK